MTDAQLQAFLAVAECGQLTEAARRLGVLQPTLSRQLQALERELGARLLQRTPRGVTLTEPGARFAVHARLAVETLRAGTTELHELEGSARGPVALGALPSVGAYALAAHLPGFMRRHPGIQLRLAEALPEPLETRVASGDLDLAILTLPLARQGLVVQRLWREPFLLVVPKRHRLAGARKPVPLVEIAAEPLIVIPGTIELALLRAASQTRGEPLRIALEVDHPESLRRMVERGVGVALLPAVMALAATGYAVCEVESTFRRTVVLAHRGSASLNSGARALARFLVETLQRR